MALHPIEDRYSSREMREVFDKKNILRKKLLVEAAIANAHAKIGNIPRTAAARISKQINNVTIQRVEAIERETQHDIMAMVRALSEVCGPAGKYVHLGATSYDIVDTAWALIFKDAINIIKKDLTEIKKVLKTQTRKNQDVIMIGRSHGQHATPITLGLKFAVYLAEVQRHLERINEAEKRIYVGKMTGAVGTGAALGKDAPRTQKLVMSELKLKEPLATTQVIQRDRHAEIIYLLAAIGATLEKIAKEIRNLQRTEIGEIEEPFGKKQVGSSTMPQKRNPWKSERICGLARVLRSNIQVAFENIALEHERDLTNSSAERVIFPESFALCDFMLREMTKILSGLNIYKENMKKNLSISNGRIMGEALMVALTDKGMGRQDAHEVIRVCSMESFTKNKPLVEVLKKNEKITKHLTDKEIERIMDPKNYLGSAKTFINRTLKNVK